MVQESKGIRHGKALTEKPKRTLTDVGVITKVDVGSDHRSTKRRRGLEERKDQSEGTST